MKSYQEKSDSSISIEEMCPDDIAGVKEIEREANLSDWPIEDYVNELGRPDSVFLAAKDNGKLIGFALTRLITITEAHPQLREAELLNIAVKKSLMRKTIGTKLLTTLINNLRSKSVLRIWLEVRESNKQALSFYAKHGFCEKFSRRDYYPLPLEDALVMCRELSHENPEQKP